MATQTPDSPAGDQARLVVGVGTTRARRRRRRASEHAGRRPGRPPRGSRRPRPGPRARCPSAAIGTVVQDLAGRGVDLARPCRRRSRSPTRRSGVSTSRSGNSPTSISCAVGGPDGAVAHQRRSRPRRRPPRRRPGRRRARRPEAASGSDCPVGSGRSVVRAAATARRRGRDQAARAALMSDGTATGRSDPEVGRAQRLDRVVGPSNVRPRTAARPNRNSTSSTTGAGHGDRVVALLRGRGVAGVGAPDARSGPAAGGRRTRMPLLELRPQRVERRRGRARAAPSRGRRGAGPRGARAARSRSSPRRPAGPRAGRAPGVRYRSTSTSKPTAACCLRHRALGRGPRTASTTMPSDASGLCSRTTQVADQVLGGPARRTAWGRPGRGSRARSQSSRRSRLARLSWVVRGGHNAEHVPMSVARNRLTGLARLSRAARAG